MFPKFWVPGSIIRLLLRAFSPLTFSLSLSLCFILSLIFSPTQTVKCNTFNNTNSKTFSKHESTRLFQALVQWFLILWKSPFFSMNDWSRLSKIISFSDSPEKLAFKDIATKVSWKWLELKNKHVENMLDEKRVFEAVTRRPFSYY